MQGFDTLYSKCESLLVIVYSKVGCFGIKMQYFNPSLKLECTIRSSIPTFWHLSKYKAASCREPLFGPEWYVYYFIYYEVFVRLNDIWCQHNSWRGKTVEVYFINLVLILFEISSSIPIHQEAELNYLTNLLIVNSKPVTCSSYCNSSISFTSSTLL